LLIDNFQRLKKIDFDLALAGFNSGSTKKGSQKLQKIFSMTIMQNYGNPENI